jgi:Fe-S-cluster containining protein
VNPGWVQPPSRALCVEQCRAACCRAPGSIELDGWELDSLRGSTPQTLIVYAELETPQVQRYRLNFSDHGGQCPMLADDATCRIYVNRPACCHAFPSQPDPRCAVWPVS